MEQLPRQWNAVICCGLRRPARICLLKNPSYKNLDRGGGKVARRDFNLYWEGRGSIKWSWGDYKEPRGITGSLRACKGEGPWRRLGAPGKFHASAKTDPKPSLGEKLEFFSSGFQGNIIKGTQVVIPPRIDGEILYRLEFWICVKQTSLANQRESAAMIREDEINV